MQDHYSVIVVGAGPVGLLIALRLGQAGVKTLLLERHTELLNTTRAVAYQPVVLNALKDLGVLDTLKKHAVPAKDGITWRDINGKRLANLPMPEDEYILIIGQKRVSDLLLLELAKYPSVEIQFGQQYAGCEQDEQRVRVMVHENTAENDNDKFITADWVVGTDGANSAVRRSLCLPFEGFSFNDFRVIGSDIAFDFVAEGFGNMSYVVDPVNPGAIVYTGQGRDNETDGSTTPLWRGAFLEPLGLSLKQDDMVERVQQQMSLYIGRKEKFDIVRAEPYMLRQRCAAQAIKGRVLLAGDALHSNNPAGGFGLTGGILDAYAIGNALARVCKNEAPESLVREAADHRRQIWLDYTNNISMMMMKRMMSTEPEDVRQREEFFHLLNTDPEFPKKSRAMIEKMAGESFAA